MRRLKSFLLILIALWLPIQAAAAVTMPFCRHAPQQAAAKAAPCHLQMDESATSAVVGFDDAVGGFDDCDNCELCHLACSGFLLAAADLVPLLTADILVPKLQFASVSHIPEPPQRPPRR